MLVSISFPQNENCSKFYAICLKTNRDNSLRNIMVINILMHTPVHIQTACRGGMGAYKFATII